MSILIRNNTYCTTTSGVGASAFSPDGIYLVMHRDLYLDTGFVVFSFDISDYSLTEEAFFDHSDGFGIGPDGTDYYDATRILFSPDGNMLIFEYVGEGRDYFEVWDTSDATPANWSKIRDCFDGDKADGSGMCSPAFSPDNNYIISYGQSSTAGDTYYRIYDRNNSCQEVTDITCPFNGAFDSFRSARNVTGITFTNDRNKMFVCYFETEVGQTETSLYEFDTSDPSPANWSATTEYRSFGLPGTVTDYPYYERCYIDDNDAYLYLTLYYTYDTYQLIKVDLSDMSELYVSSTVDDDDDEYGAKILLTPKSGYFLFIDGYTNGTTITALEDTGSSFSTADSVYYDYQDTEIQALVDNDGGSGETFSFFKFVESTSGSLSKDVFITTGQKDTNTIFVLEIGADPPTVSITNASYQEQV